MASNNIKDIEEIFLWRLIFKKFENIADVLENINKKLIEEEKINELLDNLNNIFLFNKKIDYTQVINLKKKTYKNYKADKIKELVIDILNNFILIELNKEIFKED
ncbi:MAG: hypothetical protein QW103_01230 [Candidatus Pacearchaeota archaeon]